MGMAKGAGRLCPGKRPARDEQGRCQSGKHEGAHLRLLLDQLYICDKQGAENQTLKGDLQSRREEITRLISRPGQGCAWRGL
jgi:hypothetical protein